MREIEHFMFVYASLFRCLLFVCPNFKIKLQIRQTFFPFVGNLQDGRHCDHDENERGRPDARAEGGQDLLQDGQEQRRPDHAGGVQRGSQE